MVLVFSCARPRVEVMLITHGRPEHNADGGSVGGRARRVGGKRFDGLRGEGDFEGKSAQIRLTSLQG